jgi:hypothetical protein
LILIHLDDCCNIRQKCGQPQVKETAQYTLFFSLQQLH